MDPRICNECGTVLMGSGTASCSACQKKDVEIARLKAQADSVARMLGWGNTPPHRSIESTILALKARSDDLFDECDERKRLEESLDALEKKHAACEEFANADFDKMLPIVEAAQALEAFVSGKAEAPRHACDIELNAITEMAARLQAVYDAVRA